jgi:NNP family nitrate/nitrite transporter-like MFS transporter
MASAAASPTAEQTAASRAESSREVLSGERLTAAETVPIASANSIHLSSILPRYSSYNVRVDKDRSDRALEIRLLSSQRPHMRAFYCATISFFAAFGMWFSVSPFLGIIGEELSLSRSQLWLSTICSDVATILSRFVVGPACDFYGARLPMAVVLILSSIPTALTGTVRSFAGLCAVRFGTGIAGSAFVMAQYWMGQMFCQEIIGTANAIVAGWGNLGGGVIQVLLGTGLYPFLKEASGNDEAWRFVFVVPAVFAIAVAIVVAKSSDDAPLGYYREMKRNGTMDLHHSTMMSGTTSRNAWLLAVAYACSFGVEITFNNAASLYFRDEFGASTSSAAALASIFGLTNLYARACGGIVSDLMNQHWGMWGRLSWGCIAIVIQGASIIAFGYADTLTSAVPLLILLSSCVNATEGAIFGIVPYVNPAVAGSIAGIVGLGGNVGGVCFALAFHSLSYLQAFKVMGAVAMASSAIFFFVDIPGHATLTSRSKSLKAINARRETTERLPMDQDEDRIQESRRSKDDATIPAAV